MPDIRLPRQFHAISLLDGDFSTPETTVRRGLRHLTTEHPLLKNRLFTQDHELQNFVSVFLNGEMVHDLDAHVAENAKIQVIMSLAGG